jgi:hypothetical protein
MLNDVLLLRSLSVCLLGHLCFASRLFVVINTKLITAYLFLVKKQFFVSLRARVVME